MKNSFFEGIKFALGILFVFGVLGLVYASGWHIPSEIVGGTYGPNTYVYNGSTVDFTGATVLGVATSGNVSVSAFSVHRNGTDQTGIPDSTLTDVEWTTKEYDINSEFNLTTNAFYPKTTGKYLITASVAYNVLGDQDFLRIYLYKNGVSYRQGITNFVSYSGTIGGPTATLSVVVDAEVGDNFTLKTYHTYGSNRDIRGVTYESYFSGALVGNSGGGTTYQVENGTYLPAGTVLPFNLTSCPTGWAAYEPAYGRFIRGIDPTGNTSLDPDGTRAPGSLQDDEFESHTHNAGPVQQTTTVRGTGSSTPWRLDSAGVGVSSATGGNETRPKNVALLYCIKTGGSSASTTGGVQSVFSVHRNGVDQTGVVTATDTEVEWTTSEFDTNSEFNLTANAFYPKVAGKYLLTATATIDSISDTRRAIIYIYKNGTAFRKGVKLKNRDSTSVTTTVTALVDAVPGDYFEVYVNQNTGSNQAITGTALNTYFTGARLDSDSYWSYDNGNLSYTSGPVEATSFKITCPTNFTSIESQGRQLGCMQNTEEGSAACKTAVQDCWNTYGGRLPSYNEAYIAFNNFNLTDTSDDSEFVDGAGRYYTGSSIFTCSSIQNDLDPSDVLHTTSYPYRCFIPK